MPDRDPRIDPRPGDVLLYGAIDGNVTPDRGGIRRNVVRVTPHKVEYWVGRFGYELPIETWRGSNIDAEVIHRAD